MCITKEELPIINPIINDDGNAMILAYVNADEILQSTVNLYINSKLFTYDKKYQKSKLFHEFTHIFDANKLLGNYPYKIMECLLSTYSEYHASQIELAYNIGAKSINTLPKIDIHKTYVAYENKVVEVSTDFLQPLADAICIIDKNRMAYFSLKPSEYYRKYLVFRTKSMYYLGKRGLCDMISMKQIPDTTKHLKTFSSYIRKMEHCIKIKDFDGLLIAEKRLMAHFVECFPIKDIDILNKILNM